MNNPGAVTGDTKIGTMWYSSFSEIRRQKITLAFCCVLAFLMKSCATTKEGQPNVDPFEPVNRGIYKFNDAADIYFFKPLAKGYQKVTPDVVETGIGNFFNNLTYPVTIINDLLQGKFSQAGSDTLRLLMNSTFGVFGFLDVASKVGLERHEEDFGQTFARWGVPQGPYIVVPLLGPRTVRSGIGTIADYQVSPLIQYHDSSVRDKMILLWTIEGRAALIGPDELVQEAFDPYLFLRDTYFQNREFLNNDGAVDEEKFLEEDFEDF